MFIDSSVIVLSSMPCARASGSGFGFDSAGSITFAACLAYSVLSEVSLDASSDSSPPSPFSVDSST